jgi:hypothetical protein
MPVRTYHQNEVVARENVLMHVCVVSLHPHHSHHHRRHHHSHRRHCLSQHLSVARLILRLTMESRMHTPHRPTLVFSVRKTVRRRKRKTTKVCGVHTSSLPW